MRWSDLGHKVTLQLYGNRVKYKIVSRCTKHLKLRVVSILLVLADLFVSGQHIHFALLDVQVDGSHHQPEVERQCHEGGTEQKEKKAAQYSSGGSHAEHDEQSGNGQTHQHKTDEVTDQPRQHVGLLALVNSISQTSGNQEGEGRGDNLSDEKVRQSRFGQVQDVQILLQHRPLVRWVSSFIVLFDDLIFQNVQSFFHSGHVNSIANGVRNETSSTREDAQKG